MNRICAKICGVCEITVNVTFNALLINYSNDDRIFFYKQQHPHTYVVYCRISRARTQQATYLELAATNDIYFKSMALECYERSTL